MQLFLQRVQVSYKEFLIKKKECIIFWFLHHRDGFIDKEDLHDMLASLGKDPTDAYLEDMMKEAPGKSNSFPVSLGSFIHGSNYMLFVDDKNVFICNSNVIRMSLFDFPVCFCL